MDAAGVAGKGHVGNGVTSSCPGVAKFVLLEGWMLQGLVVRNTLAMV